MNVVYAYALEAVEQEARALGASILDARDDFHKRFMTEEVITPEVESPAKVQQQREATAALMASMSRGARG